MNQPDKPSADNEYKLDEIGEEFGVFRGNSKTNADYGERLIIELEDMVAELRSTQAHIRDLIKTEK